MTDLVPAILGGGFPLPATPKGLKKGHSINGIKKINCAFLSEDACQSHQKGPLCAMIWKRTDQTDRTTDGMRLKTAWSMTSALMKSFAAAATDNVDSVGATSAADESGSACEDSDDI